MTIRMYLHKPKIVFVAQLDIITPEIPYPNNVLPFKNVSVGSVAALRGGMTIYMGSAPGLDDRGRLRYITMDEDFPTTVMIVSRFSAGTNDGEAVALVNTYITVLEEYRVWAKVPRMIGAVIRKDGYWGAFGNAANPPPLANAGEGVAGTIDGTGKFVTHFAMGNSFKWDLSVGIAEQYISHVTQWLWEAPTGTIINGGNPTTSQSIDVEFGPGFHYVYLTVWGDDYPDGSENKHTASVPVFVRDPANDLSTTAFYITNHVHNLVGVEITVELFTPLPRSEFPDGGIMMMWDDAIPTNTILRREMMFIGWHHNEDASITPEETATLHSTRMTFYNVGKKLEALPGFSMVLEYNEIASTWSQTRYPTMFYYFWFILFWHSTALEVCDLRVESSELGYYEFTILGSERSNLHEQVNSISTKIAPDHYFTTKCTGIMQIIGDPMMMTQGDRNIYKYVVDTFDDSDFLDFQFSYTRFPKVNQIRTMSMVSRHTYIIVDGDPALEILGCVAPGEAHGQGEETLEISERMCFNQTDLNAIEGNRYARMNSRYGRFLFTVPWEKVDIDFNVCSMQWVTITISPENATERELPTRFTNQKGMVHELIIQYEYTETGLIRTATFNWEMETIGRPAETTILWDALPDPATLTSVTSASLALLEVGKDIAEA